MFNIISFPNSSYNVYTRSYQVCERKTVQNVYAVHEQIIFFAFLFSVGIDEYKTSVQSQLAQY